MCNDCRTHQAYVEAFFGKKLEAVSAINASRPIPVSPTTQRKPPIQTIGGVTGKLVIQNETTGEWLELPFGHWKLGVVAHGI